MSTTNESNNYLTLDVDGNMMLINKQPVYVDCTFERLIIYYITINSCILYHILIINWNFFRTRRESFTSIIKNISQTEVHVNENLIYHKFTLHYTRSNISIQ